MKLRSTGNKFHGGILATLLACVLASNVGTAHAAPADPAIKIGVLDEVKLGEGYTKYRSEMADLDSRAKSMQTEVGARRFLNPATEGVRFDDLTKKTTRTPAEETEYQALIKTGNDRIGIYTTLTGQATRTEAEMANLNDWQNFQKANTKIADNMEDNAFQVLKTQQEATDKKYIDNANAMVQKVAVDQKLTVLLRKDSVVWSTPTVDITDEVLKRLNTQ